MVSGDTDLPLISGSRSFDVEGQVERSKTVGRIGRNMPCAQCVNAADMTCICASIDASATIARSTKAEILSHYKVDAGSIGYDIYTSPMVLRLCNVTHVD